MTTLFQEMALDVAELLAELGQPVEYVRFAQVSDLVEGTVARAPVQRQTLPTAIVPASGKGNVEELDVVLSDSSSTKRRTLAICSTVGALFQPAAEDRVYWNQQEWNIRGCTPVNVDGSADVVYLLSLVLP